MAHFQAHVIEGFLGHPAIERIAGVLPCVKVNSGELCIVVQHFLEVRHEPLIIDGISGEAAANLIVYSALGHSKQSELRHSQCFVVAAAQILAQ